MANVIITHFSGMFYDGQFQTISYYEGLISALQEQGHHVLEVITDDFLLFAWGGSNQPYSKAVKDLAISQIKQFKPDLIISFNNSSICDIERAVTCPIILWEADTFTFFNDRELIQKNQDRYHYFASSMQCLQEYNQFIDASNVVKIRIKNATNIKRQDLEKKYNISFIGNTFLNSGATQHFLKNNPEYCNITPEEVELLNKKQKRNIRESGISLGDLLYQSRNMTRARVILMLLDYGIKIFGSSEWLSFGPVDSRIFSAYDPSVVFTEHHNSLVYNRSYLSLNASHPQCITGYPWRILDIMASSAALVTDCKSDMTLDFPEVDFAFYNSMSELTEKTTRLLKDKAWREDYILQCNEAIDRDFRWKHRFKTISEVTGVDLSFKDVKGSYKRLTNEDDFVKMLISLNLYLVRFKERIRMPKVRIWAIKKKLKEFILSGKPLSAILEPFYNKWLVAKVRQSYYKNQEQKTYE